MKISRKDYDRIEKELAEPPKVIPELAELISRERCPHGTVESDTVKCRDCQLERARA